MMATFSTVGNSAWPITFEGRHYQQLCEVAGVKCRGVCGGEVSQLKGDWTDFPHCIIVSYWCWLNSFYFFFYVTVSGV